MLVARGIRGFGDGFAAIVLPAYLVAIGFGTVEIGIVAAASLLGSALLTLGVGVVAPRYELRHLLDRRRRADGGDRRRCSTSKICCWIVVVAFIGTVNPSGGDVGMLVPLEQTMLARDVTDRERTRVFARYSLIGAMSSAAGALAAAVPDVLVDAGIGRIAAFKLMFCCYGVLGLVGRRALSPLAAKPRRATPRQHAARPVARHGLQARGVVQPRRLCRRLRRAVAVGAVAVQALRHVAVGRQPVLFLDQRAERLVVSAGRLARRGVSASSTPWCSPISRRACASSRAAFAPNLAVVLGLLLVRSALSQMDVPTRTSYVMAVVTPAERAAAASVTAVPRSLASSISPAFAGVLFGAGVFRAAARFCAATLKIVYDLALLYTCRHVKPPEESLGNYGIMPGAAAGCFASGGREP